MRKRRKKLGLALGGGAARGWAHVGVISAFEEAELPVDYVAGTSMGALVGAFWAVGQIDNLKRLALHLDWKDIIAFFDIVFPKAGLIDGKKVIELLKKYFSETPQRLIPFSAVATNIVTGEEVTLSDGDIIDAVRASIAIPGIFTPVKVKEQILVDGGVVNPVPVNVVKNMGAEVVIAIDVNAHLTMPTMQRLQKRPVPQTGFFNLQNLKEKIKDLDLPYLKNWVSKEPMPNIFEIILSSIYIMQRQITRYRLSLDRPQVVIEPQVGDIGSLEFHRAPEAIAEGYKAAMEKIEEIKALANI